MVRAKFKVQSITQFEDGYSVEMYAVHGGSPENELFFKYTPSASLKMSLVKEETANEFEVGEEYYIDFTPAD